VTKFGIEQSKLLPFRCQPCATVTIDQTSSLRNSSNDTTIGKIEQINDHDHTHNDIGDDDDKEEEAFSAI
jgi:hypothetical protein